jgi:hypothetical protein
LLPFTVTLLPSSFISTPLGILTGALAILDIT